MQEKLVVVDKLNSFVIKKLQLLIFPSGMKIKEIGEQASDIPP